MGGLVIVFFCVLISVKYSQAADSTLESQSIGEADDVVKDRILNSLVYIRTNEYVTHLRITGAYIAPDNYICVFNGEEGDESNLEQMRRCYYDVYFRKPDIVAERMRCRRVVVAGDIAYGYPLVIVTRLLDDPKIPAKKRLTYFGEPDIEKGVVIAGWKKDATPILRSTCIKNISDSEIHVSLDNMAVYYEDNVSSDYDINVGDLLIQGKVLMGFFYKEKPKESNTEEKIGVFANLKNSLSRNIIYKFA